MVLKLVDGWVIRVGGRGSKGQQFAMLHLQALHPQRSTNPAAYTSRIREFLLPNRLNPLSA